MSATKDRVAGIGMWTAPSNLSKETLETEIMSLVDSLLALPVAQNYLKFEIISQRELVNPHIQALGLTEAPPSVWVVAECATEAHFAELLADAEFARLIREKHKTLYEDHLTVNAFFVDVQTKIDRPTTRHRARVVAAYQRPQHLSRAEYHTKMDVLLDEMTAHPIIQKSAQKYSLWLPNDTLDGRLRDLGFPAVEPMAVVWAETENDERMVEILTHPEIKDYFAGAARDLHVHIGSSVFPANVMTKIDRQE
ncbi:hypothetical protein B0H14DRAFT_2563058 [Mycena olivaceomarginata]|nr:hypothetical protein B0H14DRAFT_2563058 [Mycena olivaceomarginata]